MDNVTDPESTADKEASLETLIQHAIAEMKRANQGMAQERAEIERLQAEMGATSENQQIGDLTGGISDHSPQKRSAQRRWSRIRSWLTSHSTEITLLSTVVGVVGIIITVVLAIGSVGTRVESLQTQVLVAQANKFVISTPRNGAEVSMTDLISGRTPFPASMNHYVVVTARQGVDWVQDTPATVASGTVTGSARFGESDTAQGEPYTVRILATESTLNAGPLPLSRTPKDAVYSEPVTVRRK